MQGTSPIAHASIARDLEDEPDSDPDNAIDEPDSAEDESDSEASTIRPGPHQSSYDHSMAGSYRRPSFSNAGPRATVVPGIMCTDRYPTKRERHEARREERSLLRDNNVIPPKHPQKGESADTVARKLSKHFRVIPGGDRKVVRPNDDGASQAAVDGLANFSETTPLLGDPELPYG